MEPQRAVGVLGPVEATRGGLDRRVEMHEQHRHVGGDGRFGGAIELRALRLIDDAAGAGEQVGHRIGLPAGEIVRTCLGEVVEHVAVRIGPARPRRHAEVEVTLTKYGDEAGGIDLLDVDLEPGLVRLALEDLRDAHLQRRVGDGYGDRNRRVVAGFREQLARAVAVKAIGLERRIVRPADRGRDGTIGGSAGVEIDDALDDVGIHGQDEGATHTGVGEGPARRVERECVEAQARLLLDRDIRFAAELRHRLRRDAIDELQRAGAKIGKPDGLVGDRTEHDAVDAGQAAAPVSGEALEHQFRVLGPGRDLEWARTDGLRREIGTERS